MKSNYIYFNPNPNKKNVGDCSIRAIACATGYRWDDIYDLLSAKGRILKDMPSSNAVWGSVLQDLGFRRKAIPNTCPDCYTIGDFAKDHPVGTYIVCTGTHVVCIISGNVFDSWDSTQEVPQYYFVSEYE